MRNFFIAGLFTLRVFASNLLRGNRRKNIFFHILFWWLTWQTNPCFVSNKTTHCLLDYGDFLIPKYFNILVKWVLLWHELRTMLCKWLLSQKASNFTFKVSLLSFIECITWHNYIPTYIIDRTLLQSQDYNLASPITCVGCINFIPELQNRQSKVDCEWQLFEMLFMRFFYTHNFCQTTTNERKSPTKYFFNISFCWICLTRGLTSHLITY